MTSWIEKPQNGRIAWNHFQKSFQVDQFVSMKSIQSDFWAFFWIGQNLERPAARHLEQEKLGRPDFWSGDFCPKYHLTISEWIAWVSDDKRLLNHGSGFSTEVECATRGRGFESCRLPNFHQILLSLYSISILVVCPSTGPSKMFNTTDFS